MACLLLVFLCSSCLTNQRNPQKISFYNPESSSQKQKDTAKISEKMVYWTEQRKGANLLMEKYRPNYFQDAKAAGIEYQRFGPDLLSANEKDFLLGDLNIFIQLNENDLQVLIQILDDAHRDGVGIVLTMFQLPGQRYGNPNEVGIDGRLWQDEKYWIHAFEFWKQLARAVKDHPAIVTYNPLNEPDVTSAYGFGVTEEFTAARNI